MASNVTLTVQGNMNSQYQFGIWLAGKHIAPPSGTPQNVYWFVVLDRTTLNVVLNIFQSAYDTVPAGLVQYDNDRHMMIVVSLGTLTMHYPQGALFDFLIKKGGGGQLRRLAQAVTDLNCGQMSVVGYGLVSVLGPADQGFDHASVAGEPPVLITLQLMPVNVNGTTYWTPITLPN